MPIVTRGLGDPQAIVTRGLGSGISVTLVGGAVITEAEQLLTDIGVVEQLVTAVEDALAPTVELLLSEEGMQVTTAVAALTDVTCIDAVVTDVSLSVEALEVVTSEGLTTETTLSEAVELTVALGEGVPVDVSETTDATTNLTLDEDNAGA